jgi:hypothetical protein
VLQPDADAALADRKDLTELTLVAVLTHPVETSGVSSFGGQETKLWLAATDTKRRFSPEAPSQYAMRKSIVHFQHTFLPGLESIPER